MATFSREEIDRLVYEAVAAILCAGNEPTLHDVKMRLVPPITSRLSTEAMEIWANTPSDDLATRIREHSENGSQIWLTVHDAYERVKRSGS